MLFLMAGEVWLARDSRTVLWRRGCLAGTLLCSIEGSSVRWAWERCTARE